MEKTVEISFQFYDKYKNTCNQSTKVEILFGKNSIEKFTEYVNNYVFSYSLRKKEVGLNQLKILVNDEIFLNEKKIISINSGFTENKILQNSNESLEPKQELKKETFIRPTFNSYLNSDKKIYVNSSFIRILRPEINNYFGSKHQFIDFIYDTDIGFIVINRGGGAPNTDDHKREIEDMNTCKILFLKL